MTQPNVYLILSAPIDSDCFEVDSAYVSRKDMQVALKNSRSNFPHYQFTFKVLSLNGVVNNIYQVGSYMFPKEK